MALRCLNVSGFSHHIIQFIGLSKDTRNMLAYGTDEKEELYLHCDSIYIMPSTFAAFCISQKIVKSSYVNLMFQKSSRRRFSLTSSGDVLEIRDRKVKSILKPNPVLIMIKIREKCSNFKDSFQTPIFYFMFYGN